HHLRKPVVEQPQYNLLSRERVEEEYAPLYEGIGLGLTTWSPLASGILTGKYLDGVPAGSRAEMLEFVAERAKDPVLAAHVREFISEAERIGCTPAQLAIAWCVRNPNVSSVITGASSPAQVRENMAALEVAQSLDEEVTSRLASIFA
ncbi:MAG: aldo/keto reductase, partial [Actinomycetota bacterium]